MSINNAVGHDVKAALLANMLVGALRNARRRRLDLDDQARYANDAVTANAAARQFVTGQLVRVDLSAGTAGVVNAGHPLPLLVRGDRVREIGLDVEPPFGVVPGRSFPVQRLPLRPGDRVVFLTDGVQERDAAVLDVVTVLRDTTDLHPREVVQELGSAVLRATGGDLRDDATLVCLDWYGGPPRSRASVHGADTGTASPVRSLPPERG